MKKIFLLATFLCVVSCKETTKQNTNSNLVLKQTQSKKTKNVVNEVKEKNVEVISKEAVLDTVSKVEKVEKIIEVTTVKEKKPSDIKEIIQKPKIAEKEVVKQEVIKVEKEPIIAKPHHEIWDKLTKTHVSSKGKVHYIGLKANLKMIDRYLLHLQNTPPVKGWSKNEKLAYWFNLYNASTVHLIVSNYPVKSIKDINGGKPWDKKFIKSGSNLYSLNDIENKIVRPNYNEPRLHVAFNCAAVSCPNLLNAAFLPTKLNSQLNSLSKKWLNNPLKNKITTDAITISKIFDWYKGDFKEGVITFINKHNTIKVNPNAEITYMDYNWKLNE